MWLPIILINVAALAVVSGCAFWVAVGAIRRSRLAHTEMAEVLSSRHRKSVKCMEAASQAGAEPYRALRDAVDAVQKHAHPPLGLVWDVVDASRELMKAYELFAEMVPMCHSDPMILAQDMSLGDLLHTADMVCSATGTVRVCLEDPSLSVYVPSYPTRRSLCRLFERAQSLDPKATVRVHAHKDDGFARVEMFVTDPPESTREISILGNYLEVLNAAHTIEAMGGKLAFGSGKGSPLFVVFLPLSDRPALGKVTVEFSGSNLVLQ
jgi:hypothetical protein